MSVTQLVISRLYKAAEKLCTQHNANLPLEQGKLLYQPVQGGVEFQKAHYLLDSQHCEYTEPCARVIFDHENQLWRCFVACSGEDMLRWEPYSALPMCEHLEPILEELKYDPQACFWSMPDD